MKRLAFLIVIALCFTGCTGVPAPTYCYTAASATIHAVDTGMNVAGDLYRAGKITDAQKDKIVAVHNVYRPSAQAVVAGCKAVGTQDDADKQIRLIREAADKVIEALVQAGVLK